MLTRYQDSGTVMCSFRGIRRKSQGVAVESYRLRSSRSIPEVEMLASKLIVPLNCVSTHLSSLLSYFFLCRLAAASSRRRQCCRDGYGLSGAVIQGVSLNFANTNQQVVLFGKVQCHDDISRAERTPQPSQQELISILGIGLYHIVWNSAGIHLHYNLFQKHASAKHVSMV